MKTDSTIMIPPESIQATVLEVHLADKAKRQARHDEMAPELQRCLDPKYAAQKELEKPAYKWTVKVKWLGRDQDGELLNVDSEQTVTAQNETDAWAMFCDKIGAWPSPLSVKRTITRGEKMDVAQVITGANDSSGVFRSVTIGPRQKAKKSYNG